MMRVDDRLSEIRMRAYAVRIEDGEVRSLDGSHLPRQANALLVTVQEANAEELSPEEWERPFPAFPAVLSEASRSDRTISMMRNSPGWYTPLGK